MATQEQADADLAVSEAKALQSAAAAAPWLTRHRQGMGLLCPLALDGPLAAPTPDAAPPEWVVCAECNTRYETRAFGFCPRCGATARLASSAPVGPGGPTRRDPARMRLQLGGVLLILVGGFFLTGAAASFLDPGSSEAQLYAWSAAQNSTDVAPSTILLHVTQGSTPIQGANVSLVAGGHEVARGTTDREGRFNATLSGYVAARINVTHNGGTWVRLLLAPSGQPVTVTIDVATDAQVTERVIGARGLATGVATSALVLSLGMVLGGLAAVLARWRGLALVGPLPVLVLSLLLVALVISAGPAVMMSSLVILSLVGIPYALVLSGRSAFRRR